MGTHPIFESDFDCLTDFAFLLFRSSLTVISSSKYSTIAKLRRDSFGKKILLNSDWMTES